jgi:hypothetical protein
MFAGIQTASADNVSKFISGSNLVNIFRIDQTATSGYANDQEIVDIYYVYHNTGATDAIVTLDEPVSSDVQFVGGSYRTRQNASDPVNGDTLYEQA